MENKIQVAISGIGNRALPKNTSNSNWLGWVEQIMRSQEFQLVAAHDVSQDSLQRLVESGYLRPNQVYEDLEEMLREVACEAILISNPAEHHAYTLRKALQYKLHALVEKPFVNDLAEGKELHLIIKKTGKVVSVVQNWRTKTVGKLLRAAVEGGVIGKVGHVFFRYVRDRENPNYPPYIFQEKYPLLYAMGVHHLDLFRYILKDEYRSVSGCSFKPPWSLYGSDTGLNLTLMTKGGITIVYTGTISSQNGVLPQESLVIEGEKGSLFNESQWLEPPLWFYAKQSKSGIDLAEKVIKASVASEYDLSDKCILDNFYKTIRNQDAPICPAGDALRSMAALEASRLACESGEVIDLDKILVLEGS